MNLKSLALAILAFSLWTQIHSFALAEGCKSQPTPYTIDQVHIVGVDSKSEAAKELFNIYEDMLNASNSHSMENILKHYNPKFISGDNLNLEQIKSLIDETWKAYPDICYDSKPVEIRVNGDWAAIETVDHSAATAPPDKDVIDVAGKLVSDSRSLQFLRHIGNTWEITSDATVWELATIRYGLGDNVQITLSAPEQVKAGATYSATIQTNIPQDTFTIATIDNQPLTFPHPKTDDKFRALDGDNNSLQRVLTANSINHNEIVTATLGLTSVDQKNPDRPSLSLNGIATIVKRVNVVPISQEDVLAAMKAKEQVKVSANGKVDLSHELPKTSTSVVPEVTLPSTNDMEDDKVVPPASKTTPVKPEDSTPE